MLHTPGPWQVNGGIRTLDGRVIATTNGSAFPAEVDLANAYLIAAAPELIEAALLASDALHQFHPAQHQIPVGKGVCEWGPCRQLRESIAKARKPVG